MRVTILLIALIVAIQGSSVAQSTIYSFQLDSIAGMNSIQFSNYTGKKLLIVNTASLDSNFTQYEELITLNHLMKDSLVIIVVPTNSFGTEPESESVIDSVYTQHGLYFFPVSKKVAITGANAHPLFNWLTKNELNGVGNYTITKGFQKFLIDSNGRLAGVLSERMRPMSATMLRVIREIQ